MKPIFLFDIDGTLLHTERAFMRNLISELMEGHSLDPKVLEDFTFAGKTDHDIFRSLLGSQHSDDSLYHRLKHGYVQQMKLKLQATHLHLYEAVEACLHYLANAGYHLGLLTGNFREVADCKLSRSNLHHFFSFGAFGDHHSDRNKLGPAALSSYNQRYSRASNPSEYVIIGDTPKDIQCAKSLGCASVAVTTGHYSREMLLDYEPDIILDSLINPEEWLVKL